MPSSSLPATLYRSLLRLARSEPFTALQGTVLPPYTLRHAAHGPRGLVYSSNSEDCTTLPLTDASRLKACIKAAFRLRSQEPETTDSDLIASHIDDAFEALRTLNFVSPQLEYSKKYASANSARIRNSVWRVGDVVRVGNERCVVWHVLNESEYNALDDNFACQALLEEEEERGEEIDGKQGDGDHCAPDNNKPVHYYLLSPTSTGLPPSPLQPKLALYEHMFGHSAESNPHFLTEDSTLSLSPPSQWPYPYPFDYPYTDLTWPKDLLSASSEDYRTPLSSVFASSLSHLSLLPSTSCTDLPTAFRLVPNPDPLFKSFSRETSR